MVFFFPTRLGEDSSIAYLTAKRGSCGLSSKSIRLRSHQTTPPFNTKPKEGPSRLWSLLSCFKYFISAHVFREVEEMASFKIKVVFKMLEICPSFSSWTVKKPNPQLYCSVIKYLIGLFGHCTTLIISRVIICLKSHYSEQ